LKTPVRAYVVAPTLLMKSIAVTLRLIANVALAHRTNFRFHTAAKVM